MQLRRRTKVLMIKMVMKPRLRERRFLTRRKLFLLPTRPLSTVLRTRLPLRSRKLTLNQRPQCKRALKRLLL